jgi:hypothetical protein
VNPRNDVITVILFKPRDLTSLTLPTNVFTITPDQVRWCASADQIEQLKLDNVATSRTPHSHVNFKGIMELTSLLTSVHDVLVTVLPIQILKMSVLTLDVFDPGNGVALCPRLTDMAQKVALCGAGFLGTHSDRASM